MSDSAPSVMDVDELLRMAGQAMPRPYWVGNCTWEDDPRSFTIFYGEKEDDGANFDLLDRYERPDYEYLAAAGNLAVPLAVALRELQERLAYCGGELPDGPCVYCGENTNSLAGDPSQWANWYPEPDRTGISRPHHYGCMFKELEKARQFTALQGDK